MKQLLLAILMISSLSAHCQGKAGKHKPAESDYFKTGEKLELFKATDLDSNLVDLRDTSGKIIVLNFWFINCGPCRREIPDLNILVDSFSKTGKVLFYGIALDREEDLERFLDKMPFKYTIIGNGRNVSYQYGIKFFPTHVVLDGEGKVYFHTMGLASNTIPWLRKSIEELLRKS